DIFGPVETVPQQARRVFVQLKGRGIGGTKAAAERGVHIVATIACKQVPCNELIYGFLGGPKIRHGRTAIRFARAEALRHRLEIVEDTTDYFTVRRFDGRLFRFETFAASRGGDNVRGVHIAFAVLTEAGFYY